LRKQNEAIPSLDACPRKLSACSEETAQTLEVKRRVTCSCGKGINSERIRLSVHAQFATGIVVLEGIDLDLQFRPVAWGQSQQTMPQDSVVGGVCLLRVLADHEDTCVPGMVREDTYWSAPEDRYPGGLGHAHRITVRHVRM
jgi:hypothetical protein